MNRTMYVIVPSPLAALSLAFVPAEAGLVRHALGTDGDTTREIELRSIDGVAGVCDIVARTVGQFETLVSPYDEMGVERPMQREGLPDGAGMMAVDALARCGAR